MDIVPAEEQHLPRIVEILNEQVSNNYAHFGTEPYVLAEYEQAWLPLRERYPAFAAVEDDVLAFAHASPWSARCGYRWTAEVTVYVDPAHHGKGIGRALYDSLFPELQRRGFRTLIAAIALPNDPSVRLHEAMGMVHAGRIPKMGYKLGEWRDVGYWTVHYGEGPPPVD